MKRLMCLLALSVGLGLAPSVPAEAAWTEYVCTQSTPLNMRNGNGRVIGSIPKGRYVTVHTVNWNTGFAYVTYRKQSGWVAYGYLCYL